MRSIRERSRGFTLIELLIVVAIVGLLAAIAIPQFASYRKQAFNSTAVADTKNFKSAMEAYYTSTNVYPTSPVGGEAVSLGVSPSTSIGYSTSAGVVLWYESIATEFLVNSWHTSGSKQFGMSSGSTGIYSAPGIVPLHGTLADYINGGRIWPGPWVMQ